MALNLEQEPNLFNIIGFTLDDIELVDISYEDNGKRHFKSLDLDQIKVYLNPLNKAVRRFTGNTASCRYKLLLTLKHGDSGDNVGELRKLLGNQSCGQLNISFCLAEDGSCIYLSPTKKNNYEYRYYSTEVVRLKAFIVKSMSHEK